MGIKSIMSAKQIILMAYGAAKQDAVKAMVEGPVTETVPASVLQKHPNVVVIVDRDAAAVSYTHLTLPTITVRCRSRWSPYH